MLPSTRSLHFFRNILAVLTTSVILLLVSPLSEVMAQSSSGDTYSESPFRTLDLRAPNSVRNASGRPGNGFWQQEVDYVIHAALNPENHELTGRESIRYVNHSPDDLPYLWLHLEQNACQANSVSNSLKQPPLVFLGAIFDFSCQGFIGGITLESVTLGGQNLSHSVYGTTMRIDLEKPLASGEELTFEIAWRFIIPPYGLARMGRDGTLYEMAQWFPRLAVYDDVRGWNSEPYIGAGEYYLEYGDYDVTLTLPSEYIVAATGDLQNPDQVLTRDQRLRLQRAMTESAPVAIITQSEAGDPSKTRPAPTGTLDWHFTAETVRDFAFAASPDFRWDATSWEGIRIEALYRDGAANWEEAILMSRESIKYFSEPWYPYPYSHATTIEGPIEGMEYPMLTFVPAMDAREDLHWVVAHEFGHEWFPMLVGSNERFYPWMDEGFNTFIDLEGAAQYFEGTDYGKSIEWNPLAIYAENAIAGEEQPMIFRAAEQSNLFWTAYQKPALMLQLLRHEVLGPERFDFAFSGYIEAWANKHPTPTDFFRFMKDASGMDLDFYWRQWVMTAARLDQAVVSVSSVSSEGTSEIVLVNNESMVMPVEMKIDFEDGTHTTLRFPVEMWNQGPRFTYNLVDPRQIVRLTLDPRERYPDDDRLNNKWIR